MTEADVIGPRRAGVLLISVLIISICAITYELLISTASSYFLGSSVLHFSITIGLFMSFMGVGSFLSKYVVRDLPERFIEVEIILGVVGGVSAAALYAVFSLTEYYYVVAFLLIATISTLVGLEIPLVARFLKDYQQFKDVLAHVFAFDYLGALFASLLFPLFLLPYFGIVRTAVLMGIVNLLVAIACSAEFRYEISGHFRYCALSLLSIVGLAVLFYFSVPVTTFFEKFLYEDEIVYAEQTPYQRIILTQVKDDTRLYLNGDLQFSTVDEYRYHEPLVHLPLGVAAERETVLVLGGGDGLALREVLKYPDVVNVTLVDIDPAMTRLGREHPTFIALNQRAFFDPRLTVVNDDAWNYVKRTSDHYSVIIIDLPDPNDFSLGKLYSREFYELLKRRLNRGGVLVTQSTSPYFAREAFWTINKTLSAVFSHVVPYSVQVPSFGQWGFNMASGDELRLDSLAVRVPVRFLSPAMVRSLFLFDSDTDAVTVEENHLDNQILVHVYEASFEDWN